MKVERQRILIWAALAHFAVDFTCAWLILNRIPGNRLLVSADTAAE